MEQKEKKIQHIVRVHHPELTPEEHERRMARIERAAIRLLLSGEKSQLDKQNGDA